MQCIFYRHCYLIQHKVGFSSSPLGIEGKQPLLFALPSSTARGRSRCHPTDDSARYA